MPVNEAGKALIRLRTPAIAVTENPEGQIDISFETEVFATQGHKYNGAFVELTRMSAEKLMRSLAARLGKAIL